MTFTKTFLLGLFIILGLSTYTNAQSYADNVENEIWEAYSNKTFVYEITGKQAQKLLFKATDVHKLKKMLSDKPIASFDKKWNNEPEKGHFIFANIQDKIVQYSYAPAIPFRIFMFKEYGRLTLQVVDTAGNLRRDAKIKIKKGWELIPQRVNFDKESQTYRIDDWSQKQNRVLTVKLDGFVAIFDLRKNLASTGYYGDNDSYENRPDFYSYMVTDKNKYKPKETVRFKSYSLTGRKRPIKGELDVFLSGKKIKSIKPYNPGGFADEIYLHDSLKLRLDVSYNIQLREKSGRVVANTSFKYEDYELYDNNMQIKLNNAHFFPNNNELEIKATDANGLILQDAKARVMITVDKVDQAYDNIVSVPKTIMDSTITLDNNKASIVKILPDYFGKTNSTYRAYVVITTFDNQVLRESKQSTFFYSHDNIVATTINDSICFTYYKLGKETKAKGIIKYGYNTEDLQSKEIELPYKEKFNQKLMNYNLSIGNYRKDVKVSEIYPNLDIKGGVIKDSFNIKLINPLNLDVTWYTYQGNVLLKKGFGNRIDFKSEGIDMNTACYLEVFYLIGGQEKLYRKAFIPKTEHLDIDVNFPDKIYPGQTVDAVIKVKDNLGKPVRNVDLTAFATNSLLKKHVPNLPYYGKSPNTREERAWYSVGRRTLLIKEDLDYEAWKDIAKLDSITYYKFIYPKGKLFVHEINTPDSVTQFAPYIMQNGKPVGIYTIIRNSTLEYLSWTEQPKAYSFALSDSLAKKRHKLVLRLSDRSIFLDSIYFTPGKKTILSLDLDDLPEDAQPYLYSHNYERVIYDGTKVKIHTFSGFEKEYLNKSVSELPISDIKKENIYLEQKGGSYLIYNKCVSPTTVKQSQTVLAGPLNQGMANYNGGVRYKHEGGFSYKFEDNVVYKYPKDVYPKELDSYYGSFESTNFLKLNDFYLSRTVLKEKIERCTYSNPLWYPYKILTNFTNVDATFNLAYDRDKVGVHDLLLEDINTKKITYLSRLRKVEKKYISPGIYNAIVLYNNGTYSRRDSVFLEENKYIVIDMYSKGINPETEESAKWLNNGEYEVARPVEKVPISIVWNNPSFTWSSYVSLSQKPDINYVDYSGSYYDYDDYHNYYRGSKRKETKYSNGSVKIINKGGYLVRGVVQDDSGEPLIGAPIMIKGTTKGVVADIDGKFEIDVSGHSTLNFSYIGFIPMDVVVKPGDDLIVTLGEDNYELSEVVVVGYGATKRSNLTASASTVRIETLSSVGGDAKQEEFSDDADADTTEAEDQLYQELMMLNGLRSNFSDVGFWEPKLFTNKKGEASFTTTFPDNITKWDAVIYAMNRRLKTGTYRKSIKSYKPLMAELRNPQFLVEGDSSYFAGNIRNYTGSDKIDGNIIFAYDNDTLMNKNISFENSHQDKMLVVAKSTDSITTKYLFTRDDGYNDGEQRSIAVIPLGTEVAEGELGFLPKQETLKFKAKENEEVHISVTGKQLDIYVGVTDYLKGYKYACNEQLASRLIGILGQRLYLKYLGVEFKNDEDVNKIIKQLLENQNGKKLWSWWGRSDNSSYWMSAHIMRALKMAGDAGYKVDVDFNDLKFNYTDVANKLIKVQLRDIDILQGLSELNIDDDYKGAIDLFEEEIRRLEYIEDSIAISGKKKYGKTYEYNKRSYLKEKLQLWEISLKQGLKYSSDSVTKYLKKDVLGAVYCTDNRSRYWYNNDLSTTLSAYRIARADSTLRHLMEPMQMYVIQTKNNGWNTYFSSSVIYNIMPDLLNDSVNVKEPARVILQGKDNIIFNGRSCYNTVLQPNEELSITKERGIPLIYEAYTIERVTKERKGEAFEIKTYFADGDYLKAGITSKLIVEIEVKQKNAEYIQVEIPIPAGCSYNNKFRGYNSYEAYREYFKEGLSVFYSNLPIGTHKIEIDLLPRYTGQYNVNPAKVELMYFPTINANNDLRKVSINEQE